MVRIALGIAVLALGSCAREPAVAPVRPPVVPQLTVTLADLALTADERTWVDEKKKAGLPLRAATVHVAGAFEEDAQGRPSGLDYEMLRELASILGLPFEVRVPQNLKTFFSRDGTIPTDVESNPGEVYTPDLLKAVDLYIGPFSILPWRERLMTMVPIYPMQNFLAGRKGEEVRKVSQLSGKRIAVLKDSMQDNLLRAWASKAGISIRYTYSTPDQDLFEMVADGAADYTLDGGLFFAQNQRKMKGLSLSPFPTDPVRVGWSIKKSDPALASIVRKYIAHIQDNGQFAGWFQTANGTSLGDYLTVLATSTDPVR